MRNFSNTNTLPALFVPWLLALLSQQAPELSYFIAWLGSFFIFYLSLFSPYRLLKPDLPARQQVMRPIVLIQLVFAGFMCCSSIFYFINHHGYYYFSQVVDQREPAEELIFRIAECQRLCLLAHCGLVAGISVATNPAPASPYRLTVPPDRLLAPMCIASSLAAWFLTGFPLMAQLTLTLSNLSLFCSALLLILGIRQRHLLNLVCGSCIFLLHFGIHLFSGYKETIIIHILLLAFLSFPLYPKTTKLLFIPLGIGLFLVLPTFTKGIRKLVWTKQGKISEMQQMAYLSLFDNTVPEEIEQDNWDFLSNRLSEIGMFTQYVKKVPDQRPYYGFEILQNSIQALVPRIVWPDKPDTEKLAMERVYQLGIVSRASDVSAKCRPVVDGYLSAGATGVFVSIFIYGWLAQRLSQTAEHWFGGYNPGCTVVFNSIFQQLWRGNNFEFLLNNIFYGTALMMALFCLFRFSGILAPPSSKKNFGS